MALPHIFSDIPGAVGGAERPFLDALFSYLNLSAPINVMGYPFFAKGDGVTDDTAAIQAAIRQAEQSSDPATYGSNSPASGTPRVYFPSGYYKVTASLTFSKKVAFEGDGASEFSSGSRIFMATAATSLFVGTAIAQGASVSWNNLTLKAITGGAGGSLIKLNKGVSQFNSVRITYCTFGTPQLDAINIEGCDDLMIHDNLFDVAALNAISLGTSAAANVVSNFSIQRNDFFQISLKTVLVYNVISGQISKNRSFPSTGLSQGTFIDGRNTAPFQIKDISVEGNVVTNLDCFVDCTAPTGFSVKGNIGRDMGAGGGSTLDCIRFDGVCTGIDVDSNIMHGSFDTRSFYFDGAGGGSVAGNVTNNVFSNAGGTGQAINCASTTGRVRGNTDIAFSVRSVGCTYASSGTSFAPGLIASGATNSVNTTVTGAKLGDQVSWSPVLGALPTVAGVEMKGYVSAVNTQTMAYRNGLSVGNTPAAHDLVTECFR